MIEFRIPLGGDFDQFLAPAWGAKALCRRGNTNAFGSNFGLLGGLGVKMSPRGLQGLIFDDLFERFV